MFDNERIAKYDKVNRILFAISLGISVFASVVYIATGAVTGSWKVINMEGDILPFAYIAGLLLPMAWAGFYSDVALKFRYNPVRFTYYVDCVGIDECVKIKNNNFDRVKLRVLKHYQVFIICLPAIIDLVYALVEAASVSNMAWILAFAELLGTFVGAHFVGYLTIIFCFLAAHEKKKELRKQLPIYVAEKRKIVEEQLEVEKIANDKQLSKDLIEQCGLHFFIRYYAQIKRLPLRDISVEENYTPEEKNERLRAAKKIVDDNLTVYATDYILQNFSDVLTEEEMEILRKINADLK